MAGAGSSEQRSHSSSFTSGPPTFLPEGRADVLFTWSHTNHMRFSCCAMQQQCCQRQERCPQRTETLAWPEKDMPNRRVVPVQKMKAVQSFVPLSTQREYTYVYRAKITWVPLRDQCDFIRSHVFQVYRMAPPSPNWPSDMWRHKLFSENGDQYKCTQWHLSQHQDTFSSYFQSSKQN